MRPCLIAKRRKQALLGAKCVQVHNASKRPHSDPVATEDDRAWSVYTFETKYVRSKIVSCIHHLLGSNVCKVSLWITRHCSLLLVTRARYRYSLCVLLSTYFVMSRFLLRYRCHSNEWSLLSRKPDQPIDKSCLFTTRDSFRSFAHCCSYFTKGKPRFLPILLNRSNKATKTTWLCIVLRKYLDSAVTQLLNLTSFYFLYSNIWLANTKTLDKSLYNALTGTTNSFT